MLEEIDSKKLYEKYFQEKNFDAIAYYMEIISLQTELYRLDISFREKYLISIENTQIREIPKSYLEDYFFFLKNSIYRIYDFQNKYALFINSIAPYTKANSSSIKVQFPGWGELIKEINNPVLSNYKRVIEEANSNSSLKVISDSRKLMVHRKLVSPNSRYISTYVLPLGGEEATDKTKWVQDTRNILNESISILQILFSNTLNIILKEEIDTNSTN